MKEQFIPYNLALKLKELGFDDNCFGYYTIDEVLNFDSIKLFKEGNLTTLTSQSDWTILTPLWQQAFNWFRDKYELHSHIYVKSKTQWTYMITNFTDYVGPENQIAQTLESYEEAREACLRKIIELLEEQNGKT